MADSERDDSRFPGDREHHTVLDALARLTGVRSKVLLSPDDDSNVVVDPKSDEVTSAPRRTQQYQVLGELARGGVGVIFKGHDIDLGRDVAMKVLRADHASRPQMIQRFIEEAQIGGQLQHPGIIPVYEMGIRGDGRPFFTMKLIKGRTLGAHLLARTSPSHERARFLSIFEDICQTVAYAHSKGVVHRDLKPSNVMIGLFGEVLVVDWGLAKVLRGGETRAPTTKTTATQTTVIETVRTGSSSVGSVAGSLLGTPGYMAPEQARGDVEKIDARADVFALGCILCEILTGAPPYAGSLEELVELAANARLDDAYARLDDCGADQALIDLANVCLAPVPEARPRHAGDVARTIRDYLAAAEERVRSAELAASEARHKRRLTTIVSAATMLVLILGGSGLWWTTEERAAQAKQTDDAVDDALKEADLLASQARHAEALAAVARAESALSVGRAPASLRETVAAHRHRLSAAARIQRFLDQLEGIRRYDLARDEATDGVVTNQARRRAEYRTAFRDFGVDVETMAVERAASAVRETGHATEIARALDTWAMSLWHRDPRTRYLLRTALLSDDDETRGELRLLLLERDERALLAFADRFDPLTCPPATAGVVTVALYRYGAVEESLACTRRALHVHPNDPDLLINAANCLRKIEGAEAAVPPLQAARAVLPHNLPLMLAAAATYRDAGRNADALALLTAAMDTHPDAPEPQHLRALVLLDEKKFREAEVELRRALRKGGPRAEIVRDLCLALRELDVGSWHSEALPSVREEFRNDADALIGLGDFLRFHGGPAVEVLRRAVEVAPSSGEARYRLGLALADSGQEEDALPILAHALELDPSHGRAFRRTLRALESTGRFDEAVPLARTAFDRFPRHGPALAQAAYVLAEAGSVDESLDLAQAAVAADPENDLTHFMLGWVYAAAGQIEAAIEGFQTALYLDPDDVAAAYNLAMWLGRTGRLDESLDVAREGLRQNPGVLALQASLARSLMQFGLREEAETQIRLAIRGGRSNESVLGPVVEALCFAPEPAWRDADRAYPYADQLVELRDDAENHALLAAALLLDDEPEEALASLVTADERFGGEASFHWPLFALVHARLNHDAEARVWFAKAERWIAGDDVRDPRALVLRDEAAEALGVDR